MNVKIILLACLTVLTSACSRDWTRDEKNLIRSGVDTLYVFTIDSPAEERLLRSRSTDLSTQMLRSEMYRCLEELMVATVTAQGGVGIAGPQVGLLRRVVAVKRFDKSGEPFEVYPNIRITAHNGLQSLGPEGCLSVPGRRGDVLRYRDIEITYCSPMTLRDTSERVLGYTAVIFQHECDHLDGVLYIDCTDAND